MTTSANFGFARKGSQRWLQVAVERAPELLNQHLRQAAGLGKDVPIEWLSPTRDGRYAEYRDAAFLKLLGLTPKHRVLREFWPARGPVWDGLARVPGGPVFLIEAKAHIPELVSPGSKASPKSRPLIERSLDEVRKALAPKSTLSWSALFYQYTNRLAFLYYLRTLNRFDVHLVHLLCLNARDVNGPATKQEWEGALLLLRSYLGLSRHKLSPFVHDIFLNVDELPSH